MAKKRSHSSTLEVKLSETSHEASYREARLQNDDHVLSILDSFGEDISASKYGYHRKCYQKYTHKKLLNKLSAEGVERTAETIANSNSERHQEKKNMEVK